MYSYIHDPETGGLLLTSSPTKLSLEPRPVYAPEVEITPEGEKISKLLSVDVDEICRKNEKLLKTIERATARRITRVKVILSPSL